MKKFLLRFHVFVIVAICGSNLSAQPISTRLYGQNSWMPDTIGNASACPEAPCILYGKLHLNWAKIQNSGSTMIRYGGIAPDRNMPTNFQYIRMIDSIRAKGMEPVIQVPFWDGRYTASQAAAIVQYINVTKTKNIKYWIIGNEPDLKYSYTTAAEVAAYFKPFASAMKAVDPSIKIIGPECAWYNSSIINGLTTPGGPSDITGTDANGRYYVDIISFHYYPFNGTQTRPQVITKLTQTGGFQDNLVLLNARLTNANSYHGRTGANLLKCAVTEANVNYQNSSTDDVTTLGANSFIGGQFVAEMYAVGMKNKVEMINLWSVVEGNTTALNIGYIDKVTGNKKPLFHHYKLVADNFKGNYIGTTDNQANVKAFASQNSSQIAVMVMNQELSGSMPYTVRLNTATVSGTSALKINVNAGLAIQYDDVIPNQSTYLLIFNSAGTLIRKCEYTLALHAMVNAAPTCVEILASPLPVSLISFEAQLEDEAVQLSWHTASETNNDYFTIQKTRDGISFEDVATVDGAGTTTGLHSYAAADHSPYAGTSYYRLKQTDYDGTTTYYGMEQINVNGTQSSSLSVFPNPSNGEGISITMEGAAENNILEFAVFDAQGRKLFSRSAREESGNRQFRYNFPERLPSGMYFISATTQKDALTARFIVTGE
jgi:hypothetical protein